MAGLACAAYLFGGLALSFRFFKGEGRAAWLLLGGVWATVFCAVLPALWAFLWGFTAQANLCAAGTALVLGAACLPWGRFGRTRGLVRFGRLSRREVPLLMTVGLLCAVAFTLTFTHVLRPDAAGALHSGQSTYGDMAMHLAFITSLAETGRFPPVYPLLAGEVPIGYPFLCETNSAGLYALGMDLRLSYILPMLLAMGCIFLGAYLLFRRMARGDARKAVLSTVLFFVGGGFGFAYFLDLLRSDPGNFTRIFTAFYETPTNYTSHNVLWVNPICDLLIPQRATLFGWAVLFACLYLLYRAAFEGKTRYFYPLGILAGCLPLIHTHSFLALGIISFVLFLRAAAKGRCRWGALKPWLAYGVLALCLALPQLFAFTFRQSSAEGFLRLHLNWANTQDEYLWFYIKNIGLTFLLLIPAFLHADARNRWFYLAGLPILILCEFMVFQPNTYDNNKLLYVWHLLGCGIVGILLVDVYDRLRGIRGRVYIAALTLTALCLSGVLTLGREAVSDYELFSAASVKAADFARENTPPTARFLTADNHNNAIASLAGRSILCGSGSYLYFHGVDYAETHAALRQLYEQPTNELLEQWGIDYVLIGAYERGGYAVEEDFYARSFPVVYDDGQGTLIYDVRTRAVG